MQCKRIGDTAPFSLAIGTFAALAVVLFLLPSALAVSKYKVLHAFGSGKDGAGLWGRLALDGKGNLYGMTVGGGAHNSGTVFELPHSRGRWTEAILHSFCSLSHCADGAMPFSHVIVDGDGTLYGTTSSGGRNNGGTLFQMSRNSVGWSFAVIDGYGSGAGSDAGVILDQAGNLYGNIGPGDYSEGAVTELVRDADGWTRNYLYSFCHAPYCPDGAAPASGVTFDSMGNLYGTTEYGGMGQLGGLGGGTAYELKHEADGTWKHVVLHNFPAFRGDGFRLLAGMVLDKSGNLYGATIQGGSIDCGTVFKLTHSGKGGRKVSFTISLNPRAAAGQARSQSMPRGFCTERPAGVPANAKPVVAWHSN